MLAVIQTGGKQYLVKNGDVLTIEKIDGDKGQSVSFDMVLMTADDDGSNVKLGMPVLENVTVKATIEDQGRAAKIRVVKYKRKVRYKKAHGHRQHFTKVKIA